MLQAQTVKRVRAQRNNRNTLFLIERSSTMKPMMRFFTFTAVLALVLSAPSAVHAQSAAATYKAKCAGCHGADGKGNTTPGKALGVHDFTSAEVTKMSDTDLVGIVTTGKNKMPAYGKSLKAEDIAGLVAFIRGLSK